MPCTKSSQHSKSAIDPSFVPNPNVDQNLVAQDSHLKQESRIPLDPNLGLANELDDSKQFAQRTLPSATSVTQHPDPNVQNPAGCLSYSVQDSNMQDPELPHPNSSQDLKSAVDPRFIVNFDVARDLVAQGSSSYEEPSFALHSNLEHTNLNPTAISNALPGPAFAQDPNLPDLGSFMPILVQDSDLQDQKLLRPNLSQEPKSTIDSAFLPNLNVAQDPVIQDSNFHQKPRFPLDPNLSYANEHGNFKSIAAFHAPKALSFAQNPNVPDLVSVLPKFVQSYERIRRSTQELQDMDKNNMHLISQFRGDLANLRIEKLTLEKANHSLARENSEAKAIQGKAEKDTELIRKLNCELGRIRKKQSMLEKANESLANDYSKSKVDSDTLRQSNINLKEENRHLRASIADLRPFNSELIQAKETIRAQKAEIQDSVQRIAALNSCIDKISPELLWRTEQLQEAEECVFHEESVSKYYRDRCCLLWNKCNALESAGDSRETEFAELELEKEQRHTKEREALIFRIGELQAKNKQPAQRAGDVGVGINVEQADKVAEKVTDIYKYGWSGFTNEIETQIQEPSLPKGHLDDNQKLSKLDEEVGNPISYATAADIILAVEECTAVTAGTTEDSQKRKDQGNLRWGKGF